MTPKLPTVASYRARTARAGCARPAGRYSGPRLAVARAPPKASNLAENTSENTGGKNGPRAWRNEPQLEGSSPAGYI